MQSRKAVKSNGGNLDIIRLQFFSKREKKITEPNVLETKTAEVTIPFYFIAQLAPISTIVVRFNVSHQFEFLRKLSGGPKKSKEQIDLRSPRAIVQLGLAL
jgi:hypothetical protein